MTVWRSIDTIPLGKIVRILSVTGIDCLARTCNPRTRWIRRRDRWGPRRINCWRLGAGTSVVGDIVAVKWRSAELP